MPAQEIFSAYLEEIRLSIDFYRYAVQLRPRLGDYLSWDGAGPEERALFQNFMGANPTEERVYQAALVSVCAGLEQFTADLLDDLCDEISEKKLSGDQVERLFPGILKNHRHCAGHPLDRIHDPRPYWRLDYDQLIASLATTAAESAGVRLYGRAAATNVRGIDMKSINAAFERISIQIPWNDICSVKGVQKALGTAAQAETRRALDRVLTRMVEIRNSLAHSQGSEIVGYGDLSRFISVADELAKALSRKLIGFVQAAKH